MLMTSDQVKPVFGDSIKALGKVTKLNQGQMQYITYV